MYVGRQQDEVKWQKREKGSVMAKKGKCPKCGSPDTFIWNGWAWRDGIKNIHRRRCACGKMYGVKDEEGYKKLEGINAGSRETTHANR